MDNKNYLEHYGILGMKWGIRRYQNESGKLTPEGKARAKRLKEKYVSGNKLTGSGKIAYANAIKQQRKYEERIEKLNSKNKQYGKTDSRLARLEKNKVDYNRIKAQIESVYGNIPVSRLKKAESYAEGYKQAVLIGQLIGGLPGGFIAGAMYEHNQGRLTD